MRFGHERGARRVDLHRALRRAVVELHVPRAAAPPLRRRDVVDDVLLVGREHVVARLAVRAEALLAARGEVGGVVAELRLGRRRAEVAPVERLVAEVDHVVVLHVDERDLPVHLGELDQLVLQEVDEGLVLAVRGGLLERPPLRVEVVEALVARDVHEEEAPVGRHRLRGEVEGLDVPFDAERKRIRDDARDGVDALLEVLRGRRRAQPLQPPRARLQQHGGDPEHRRLAVGVAVHARPVEVVLEVVLLAGPHAHVGDVREGVEPRAERKPSPARRRAVLRRVEPAARDARRERIREHRRAGRLAPVARVRRPVHELAPEAVRALVLQERRHHRAVAFQDARAVFAVLRQPVEDERHAGGHPAVAAPPHVLHVGRVVEEALRRAVLQLQLVEVEAHLARRAVDVGAPARRAERLALEDGNHVHVVDPEARLRRVALCPVGLLHLLRRRVALLDRPLAGRRPLRVRIEAAHLQVARILVREVDLVGQRAEDRVVHVVGTRAAAVLGPPRQEVVEEADELRLAGPIAVKARTGERVHPEGDDGILHGAVPTVALVAVVALRAVVLRARGEELVRHPPRDRPGVRALGQVAEVRRERRARPTHGDHHAGGHGNEMLYIHSWQYSINNIWTERPFRSAKRSSMWYNILRDP